MRRSRVHIGCGEEVILVRDRNSEVEYFWCVSCYEPASCTDSQIDSAEVIGTSALESPYLVTCAQHGQVFLTEEEFISQIGNSNDEFICPLCRAAGNNDLACEAEFSQENFNQKMHG